MTGNPKAYCPVCECRWPIPKSNTRLWECAVRLDAAPDARCGRCKDKTEYWYPASLEVRASRPQRITQDGRKPNFAPHFKLKGTRRVWK